jgi:hypothetical protein
MGPSSFGRAREDTRRKTTINLTDVLPGGEDVTDWVPLIHKRGWMLVAASRLPEMTEPQLIKPVDRSTG